MDPKKLDYLRELEYRMTHTVDPDQKLLDKVRKAICDLSNETPSTKNAPRNNSSGMSNERNQLTLL